MKRHYIVILALLCLFAGFVIGKQASPPVERESSQAATPVVNETPIESESGLHLDSEQREIAGIETEPAKLEFVQSGFEATGSLVAPPTHQIQVNSPVAGVVQSLHVQVGDQVDPGQTLAVLGSQEVAQAQSDYHQALVELQLAKDSLANTKRLITLDDLTNRPVEQARQEISSAQARLATYRAQEKTTEATLKRIQKLLDIGIASQQQLDQARADSEAAKSSRRQAEQDLEVARQYLERQKQIQSQGLKGSTEIVPAESRLTAAQERLQIAQSRLDVLGAGAGRDGEVVVKAPASGVVQTQSVAQGQNITTGQTLFELLDPRILWLWVNVYESDLPKVSLNQKVRLSVAAYPERSFEGLVSYVEPSLDLNNRTARAQVKIHNIGTLLSPGMLATVEMINGTARQLVVIPKEAVVRINDQDFVYLESESGSFERVLVVTAPASNGRIAVTQGLDPGENIVVKGSYYLKSEELKGSLGDDD